MNKLIELYCAICHHSEDSRIAEKMQHGSNNKSAQFTDVELMTAYLWGAQQGLLTRKSIYNFIRTYHLGEFQKLPSYQAFCRRLNRLAAAFAALAEVLFEQKLASSEPTHGYVLDSCPVMVSVGSRSNTAKTARDLCNLTRNPTKNLWYHGVKLHVFAQLRPHQLPIPCAVQISKASLCDLWAAKQIDLDCAPVTDGRLYTESGVPKNISLSTVYDTARQKQQQNGDLPKILIVEDNDELREYLRNTLSDDYTIQVCSDGKQALDIVKEYMPNMIISDIMMPEMRGDELCHKLKNDIETSHIPIILLTALNNDRNIIEGLKTGADEYIVKPFNIGILRATIANILTNRSLLRHKYANLELNDEESDTACINCSTDIDWKFISTVKKSVEDNMDNSSFTVDVLCNLLNMSRTSFYNKIKALTDQAPADYIRLIRLKRAAQLLKEQQHSITEVAEMTGFSDAKYFREVFKKHFNVSPSQYAKQKEEDNNGKMI